RWTCQGGSVRRRREADPWIHRTSRSPEGVPPLMTATLSRATVEQGPRRRRVSRSHLQVGQPRCEGRAVVGRERVGAGGLGAAGTADDREVAAPRQPYHRQVTLPARSPHGHALLGRHALLLSPVEEEGGARDCR